MEKMEIELMALFKNKKVFITGHTGFKGSWLLGLLHHLGADVKGYALKPENLNDLYNLIDGDNLCESVIADIRDLPKLTEEIITYQPDFIFHLAAQPLVRLSYDIPLDTLSVNIMGTANVLEALKQLQKKCVVVMITTDKVYKNIENNHYYVETDNLGGYDPYSSSKACAELVIDSYINSFFHIRNFEKHQKSISVGRAGNVIGGGYWAKDRIIPDIIRALISEKKVIVRNPNSIRPWQHVLEPLLGYLTLAKNQFLNPKKFGRPYNFGPLKQDLLTVKDLVNISIENWGKGEYIEHYLENAPHEANLLQLDITKAMSELKWFPKLNSAAAIKWTIEWYSQFQTNPQIIKEYTISQIIKYLKIS